MIVVKEREENKVSIVGVYVFIFILVMLVGLLVTRDKLGGEVDILVYIYGLLISVCYALGLVFCVNGIFKSVKESIPMIKSFFEGLTGVSDKVTKSIMDKK